MKMEENVMKKYITPDMQIAQFAFADIITASRNTLSLGENTDEMVMSFRGFSKS